MTFGGSLDMSPPLDPDLSPDCQDVREAGADRATPQRGNQAVCERLRPYREYGGHVPILGHRSLPTSLTLALAVALALDLSLSLGLILTLRLTLTQTPSLIKPETKPKSSWGHTTEHSRRQGTKVSLSRRGLWSLRQHGPWGRRHRNGGSQL